MGRRTRRRCSSSHNGATLIGHVDCGLHQPCIPSGCKGGRNGCGGDRPSTRSARSLPPAVALVNPNREDDLSGQGICVRQAWCFSCWSRRCAIAEGTGGIDRPFTLDLLSLLDIVALATVCDVVPLKGLNRAYVVKGLIAALICTMPGLRPSSRRPVSGGLSRPIISGSSSAADQCRRPYRGCGAWQSPADDR